MLLIVRSGLDSLLQPWGYFSWASLYAWGLTSRVPLSSRKPRCSPMQLTSSIRGLLRYIQAPICEHQPHPLELHLTSRARASSAVLTTPPSSTMAARRSQLQHWHCLCRHETPTCQGGRHFILLTSDRIQLESSVPLSYLQTWESLARAWPLRFPCFGATCGWSSPMSSTWNSLQVKARPYS